jgi:hypothetical protein
MNQETQTKRKLWWVADNKAEADQVVADLTSKGARIVKVELQHPSTELRDIVFELDPTKALGTLGYQPDEEEWLKE